MALFNAEPNSPRNNAIVVPLIFIRTFDKRVCINQPKVESVAYELGTNDVNSGPGNSERLPWSRMLFGGNLTVC